jgi:hypothetical protein
VPLNDPTDTGGMFLRRRPGTATVHYREVVAPASRARARFDRALAALLLVLETLVGLSLWGPQPVAWLWVGSQIEYLARSPTLGVLCAFVGMLATLLVSIAVMKRIDRAWTLVRRAAGYDQRSGAIEWIFVVSVTIAVSIGLVWFVFFASPAAQLGPQG